MHGFDHTAKDGRVGCRGGEDPGQLRVRGRWLQPVAQCVDLGDPRPVGRDLVPIERRDRLFGGCIPGGGEGGRIIEVLAYGMPEQLGMDQSDAETAANGRVGAGPGIADRGEPGHHWHPVDHEPPVAVHHTGDGQHAG